VGEVRRGLEARWEAAPGRFAAIGVLVVAVVVSGAIVLSLDSGVGFVADDWELLVARGGWGIDVFAQPFHENVVIGPALVYKLLLAVFGMGSALPFYVVSIGLFLLGAVLLFAFLRSRVGDWLAVVAAISVLFLGAAFEDLLWAFQIGYFGCMAAGLGVLLALDREEDRADRLACGLLVVALAFSSLGLVFAVGALVDVALGRRPRARRLYVALAPLALFALWWLGWGHDAESNLSLHNLTHLASWAYDSAAAGIVSLLGLATDDGTAPDQHHLIWGQILLPLLAGGVGLRIYRDRGISRGLAVALTLALAFWILAGLNRNEARFPTSSRYQFPSAVFLLLVAGESLRGLRIPRFVVPVAAAVAILAAVGGVSLMQREQRDRWEPAADSIRASLAAVDLTSPSTDPAFPIVLPPGIEFSAATYLEAVRDHGSPAYDEAELTRRPAPELTGADLTMAQAEGLALVPPDPGERALGCQDLDASVAGATGLTLLRGGFTLSNSGASTVEVMLSRFAAEPSVSLGPLEPGVTTSLEIPDDEAKRPWSLGLRGAGTVRLCTTEAPS
jgi:hypothetical protein